MRTYRFWIRAIFLVGLLLPGIAMSQQMQTQPSSTLKADPLILADNVRQVPPTDVRGSGPVSMKVTPKAGSEYLSNQFLIPYLELYNASIDQITNRPDLQITFVIKSGNKILSNLEDPKGRSCYLSAKGVSVVRSIPLRDLDPGDYSLEVKVLDRKTGQSLSTGADFIVKR